MGRLLTVCKYLAALAAVNNPSQTGEVSKYGLDGWADKDFYNFEGNSTKWNTWLDATMPAVRAGSKYILRSLDGASVSSGGLYSSFNAAEQISENVTAYGEYKNISTALGSSMERFALLSLKESEVEAYNNLGGEYEMGGLNVESALKLFYIHDGVVEMDGAAVTNKKVLENKYEFDETKSITQSTLASPVLIIELDKTEYDNLNENIDKGFTLSIHTAPAGDAAGYVDITIAEFGVTTLKYYVTPQSKLELSVGDAPAQSAVIARSSRFSIDEGGIAFELDAEVDGEYNIQSAYQSIFIVASGGNSIILYNTQPSTSLFTYTFKTPKTVLGGDSFYTFTSTNSLSLSFLEPGSSFGSDGFPAVTRLDDEVLLEACGLDKSASSIDGAAVPIIVRRTYENDIKIREVYGEYSEISCIASKYISVGDLSIGVVKSAGVQDGLLTGVRECETWGAANTLYFNVSSLDVGLEMWRVMSGHYDSYAAACTAWLY